MLIRIATLYPNTPGSHFDHNYYLQVHFPLAMRLLAPYGMRKVEMNRVLEGMDPAQPAPYHCMGLLYFDSVEDFRKGMAAHGAEISADVPNYTSVRGTVVICEEAGECTAESLARSN
jgi:uncharacterized protein (TIGR02118 family)